VIDRDRAKTKATISLFEHGLWYVSGKVFVILTLLATAVVAGNVASSAASRAEPVEYSISPTVDRRLDADAPVAWRAEYTQIHFDDIETLQPSIGPSFILTSAGKITDVPQEVISGAHSVKGSYTGSETYTWYLGTDPDVMPLTPLHTYRITFDYRILATPDQGFETLFYSPTGGGKGSFLPSITVDGQTGDKGSATLINTLGNYTDYQAGWNIIGTGAIAVDNIQIVNLTTGQTVATEDAELMAPGLLPGLHQGAVTVTTDPNEVIDGNASLLLSQYGSLETDSSILPLAADTIYIIEFDYQILDPGTHDEVITMAFQPVETTDWTLQVAPRRRLLKNAPSLGTFSAGALTAYEPNYYLRVSASEQASVVIDNVRIFRQDSVLVSRQPWNWVLLPWIPYPRLGHYLQGNTQEMAQFAYVEGTPFTYSVAEIEERLAFSDVVAGFGIGTQTMDPGFARRMQTKNPRMIFLPYRVAQEQQMDPDEWAVPDETRNLDLDFLEGVADEWIAKDTSGNPVPDPTWPGCCKMNISEFAPAINGQTFNDYLVDWVLHAVMASGVWDGIFFDNLFGRINPHILNYDDPALLNYDLNLNGQRDETPAWASDVTRAAAIQVLETLRAEVGDREIIMGNTGFYPEIFLAPQVNGFIFECIDESWNSEWFSGFSEAGWRRAVDDYFMMQAETMMPHINIIEGCGRTGSIVEPDHDYLEPSEEDISTHRFTLGTTLLGDGFYDYDLFDARSAPYWFDEFSVNKDGVAVEDRRHKGYLGLALNEAMELKTPSTVIWEEDFDAGTLPPEMWADPGVYVSQQPGEIISGTGSLIIDNPDHTQQAFITAGTIPNDVPLTPGNTYMIEFDWEILETVDGGVASNIWGTETPPAYQLPGVVAGDSGRVHFPLTLQSGSDFTAVFHLGGGGGKVAFDNVRITQGGAGPWRRDFENGFVLVNPINRPYTFEPDELSGPLSRTGIKRILGTQAPQVNSGQPVTDSLTLAPFDAIILLTDRIQSDDQLDRQFLPAVMKEE
jgi:hypothetical protein